MVSYLTLAQSQAEMERLLVQMVQANVPRARLEELFPGGVLDGLDEALISKVKLSDRIVPESIAWGGIAPRLVASNNWVIAAKKSATGNAIFANDPHFEVNRLPAVLQELVLKSKNNWGMGATIPGLPSVLIGRTRDVAWGATYAFMDSSDSWIEHCKSGHYRRGDEWVPFKVRREQIKRKGRTPFELVIYENDHGVLDGDPHVEGYYLATRWSGASSLRGIL